MVRYLHDSLDQPVPGDFVGSVKDQWYVKRTNGSLNCMVILGDISDGDPDSLMIVKERHSVPDIYEVTEIIDSSMIYGRRLEVDGGLSGVKEDFYKIPQ